MVTIKETIMSEQKLTPITINGETLILEMLPEDVQVLIKCHTVWSREYEEQKLEAAKTEAAIREINREIGVKIKAIKDSEATTGPGTQDAQNSAPK